MDILEDGGCGRVKLGNFEWRIAGIHHRATEGTEGGGACANAVARIRGDGVLAGACPCGKYATRIVRRKARLSEWRRLAELGGGWRKEGIFAPKFGVTGWDFRGGGPSTGAPGPSTGVFRPPTGAPGLSTGFLRPCIDVARQTPTCEAVVLVNSDANEMQRGFLPIARNFLGRNS